MSTFNRASVTNYLFLPWGQSPAYPIVPCEHTPKHRKEGKENRQTDKKPDRETQTEVKLKKRKIDNEKGQKNRKINIKTDLEPDG